MNHGMDDESNMNRKGMGAAKRWNLHYRFIVVVIFCKEEWRGG